jgi:antimicrobial peptide system SdpB family protein
VPHEDLRLAQLVAAAVLLVVASGWRPRLTGIPHWWISYSFAVSATIPDGGDQVTQILALLLVPVTLTDPRAWHWQRAPRAARPLSAIIAWSALFVARLQVAGIYLDSSLSKLGTPEWVDGTAFYYWSTDPAFGTPLWMRGLLEPVIASPLGVALLTWGPVALELAIALGLVLDARSRRRLLPGGIAFHAGIAVMIGLVSFAVAMCAALILFLRPMGDEFDLTHLARLRALAPRVRVSPRRDAVAAESR